MGLQILSASRKEYGSGIQVNPREPRTLGAANMLASVAGRSAGFELKLAAVTDAPCRLLDILQHPVLRTGNSGRKRKVVPGFGPDLLRLSARLWRFLLCARRLLRRESRTLLAPLVLAAGADLVRTERGLAAMTLPVHAHPYLLLHALGVLGGTGPLMGFKREAILLKHLPRSLVVFNIAGFRYRLDRCGGDRDFALVLSA